jgi:hypothetical protein
MLMRDTIFTCFHSLCFFIALRLYLIRVSERKREREREKCRKKFHTLHFEFRHCEKAKRDKILK